VPDTLYPPYDLVDQIAVGFGGVFSLEEQRYAFTVLRRIRAGAYVEKQGQSQKHQSNNEPRRPEALKEGN